MFYIFFSLALVLFIDLLGKYTSYYHCLRETSTWKTWAMRYVILKSITNHEYIAMVEFYSYTKEASFNDDPVLSTINFKNVYLLKYNCWLPTEEQWHIVYTTCSNADDYERPENLYYNIIRKTRKLTISRCLISFSPLLRSFSLIC